MSNPPSSGQSPASGWRGTRRTRQANAPSRCARRRPAAGTIGGQMTLADAAAAAFTELAGRPPDGVWRAPGRVNLIGEHTDYNDGFVLPVAIDRSVVVAAGRRDDDGLRCWSTREGPGAAGASPPVHRPGDIGPGRSTGWRAYVEGVAWALRRRGARVPGLDVVVHGDLPVGAGLSSSAALEAAAALAFSDLGPATGLDRAALALVGQEAENDVVGMPCGIMDQTAVLLGRAGQAVFLDTRSRVAE